MRQALVYCLVVDRPIVDHCEDLDLSREAVMHEGEVSARLGLRGVPAAAEEILVARDIALARMTGGRLHLAHLSTRGSVELVRWARERGLRVSAEATPHHLTLTDALVAGDERRPPFDTSTRVNPPLRSAADVEAVVGGLADGTIEAIATDHAPHATVDKLCEYDLAANGISGLETALGLCLRLVHRGQLSLLQLVERLTVGPARLFDLPYGRLRGGDPADLVIFDPNEPWVVDPTRFHSKGKHTPVAGWTLRGRVRATLFGGQTVYGELP
jgi:dihydroorotase